MRRFPTEYFVLAHVRDDGPVIGYFDGHPITCWVRDHWGKRYSYAGLAPRRANGTFNLELLHPGEWIVEPGLVYAAAGPDRRT